VRKDAKTGEKQMIDFTRPGRIISASKTSRLGHICVFNANVCSKSRGKFWFGDVDITADAEDLKRLAAQEGEEIYVLRERDARFENEEKPLLGNAIAMVSPSGEITFG
jgi:hypothetical protein